MKGDQIPDSDHVARFCSPIRVCEEQVQATAFFLKLGEKGLSVNWLEYLNCSNREHEINEIRNIYSTKLKVGARAKIAILNVGAVREKVLTKSTDKRNIEFLHDPIEDVDPSHSGIYNLAPNNEFIAELILETIREVYPARH